MVVEDKITESISRNDTRVLKGIAVILMVIHHLFIIPERINSEIFPNSLLFSIFDSNLMTLFGRFGKICVSLFFFLSGFGLYRKFEKNSAGENTFFCDGIILTLKKLYLSYWKVFIIFIPLAYFLIRTGTAYCISDYCYARYVDFRFQYILSDFIGWTHIYNGEWWFFRPYVICLLLAPLYLKFIKNRRIYSEIFYLLVFYIISVFVLPYIMVRPELHNSNLYNLVFCNTCYTVCFAFGIICSKNDRIEKICDSLSKCKMDNIFVDVTGLFFIFFARNYVVAEEFDFLYFLFFVVFFLRIVKRFRFLYRVFGVFGKHSTNIWLFHSFFIYYFGLTMQKVLFFPKFWPLIVIWSCFLFLVVSICFDKLWKYLSKLKDKIWGVKLWQI